jgi:DNA-directed RNA polymerase I subunit RPA2
MEIGHVAPSNKGQYPGLFLFSTLARMMRPVKYLGSSKKDMVGTFEQVYMDIACMPGDIVPGITTHIEYSPTNILSVVANLTPFSDFNQSPRNMYQCQMGKQSMGTPALNLPHRTDNKMYRLQTGQTPVVRPKLHDEYGVDSYPNGMNAVVAVISYTGYDMEDASIINKSSHERGYGYGTIYKSEFIDLSGDRGRSGPITQFFGLATANGSAEDSGLNAKKLQELSAFVDFDGLPHIGIKLTNGDPLYAVVDDETGKVRVVKYKSMEDAFVDEVRILGIL